MKIDKDFTINVGQFGLWETHEFPYLFGGEIVDVMSQWEFWIKQPNKEKNTLICYRPNYICDVECGTIILKDLKEKTDFHDKKMDEVRLKADRDLKLYFLNRNLNIQALKETEHS